MFVLIIVLVLQLVLILSICIFIAIEIAHGISAYMDVPFVATPKRLLPIIAGALRIRPGDTVYDLGCGDGRLLFHCSKQYPASAFIGIERNPLLIVFARIKAWALGRRNISFRREDIFTTDFSDATRIYTFLLPSVMDTLFSAGKRSSLKDVRLVSRAFKVPDKELTETIALPDVVNICGDHELHVYEF